ncbi:MAG: transcription termination/antitermination protein NusG [Alphaproteobacteria bacterium]|nr:transcription termination/antitermination protein NusG [Alphaproteobacteria bacterium]MBP9877782.1 transcription termination/antitermination protein NusG [Alphaproteobacteria bacterium]
MTARWYVVQCHSGSEKKVAQSIREKAETEGLKDSFEEILVPSHEVVEVRRGKKVQTERNFYPGYILVKMSMSDTVWHMVKNISRVSGFLGGSGKPVPMSEKEVVKIMSQVKDGVEKIRPTILFDVGEEVRVSDGPFASFNGIVEEVDLDKARLKVSVSIFGRATPVELDFSQVEKV